MIHDYRELLTAPARARMLPEQILTRLAELEAAYPEIANASHPSAVVEEARRGVAECLGLAAIPRTESAEWQVLAELPGEGFTIEKGTFEAVPGLVVPAHVYRPSGAGPHPGVVHSLGHWMENARLEPDIQRYNARLARAGILVLAYDTLGQGERRIGWHQHGQLAPLLVGFTSLGVMVSETLGALDLLAARADVDAARLGVTGASGGGFVSTFAAAVDRRIAAAAICCILNTHLGQVRDAAFGTGWDGWVDLCNQVPRLAATASMGLVLGCAAPEPRDRRARDRRPALPHRRCARRRARGRGRLRGGRRARARRPGRGLRGPRPARCDARCRRLALAAAFGLPAPAAEAPLALLESPYAVTHLLRAGRGVARADARSRPRPAARGSHCRRTSTRTP